MSSNCKSKSNHHTAAVTFYRCINISFHTGKIHDFIKLLLGFRILSSEELHRLNICFHDQSFQRGNLFPPQAMMQYAHGL